jgi:predicted nucleic acid-binding protein
MRATRFLDTNILLYAISRAAGEAEKAQRALSLLEDDNWALSVQVLQEFYVQATRSTKPDRISHEQAVALIEAWLRFRVQEITLPLMQAALKTQQRHQLTYWDAAILEAARAAGCREVYSEDLAAGRDYDGIRVVNPFA